MVGMAGARFFVGSSHRPWVPLLSRPVQHDFLPLLHVCTCAGSEELSVDLKGVLFSASIHPLAGSALVVNIQPTEAKVGKGGGVMAARCKGPGKLAKGMWGGFDRRQGSGGVGMTKVCCAETWHAHGAHPLTPFTLSALHANPGGGDCE